MHDAFISYARSDSREFVARLAPALEAVGKDVFVDLDDIPPASRWERDLREGIAASSVFIFVISPASVASEHCRRELDHAREANKRIVPVAYLEVPDAQVPAAVAQLNWIPQQGGFDDDFQGASALLVEAIETDADALRNHSRWQERAEAWRDGDRERGLLATGAELREADAWLEAQTGHKPEPTPVQAEWVAAGRRHAVRRQRGLFAAAIMALLVSAVLGVLALVQRNEARDQRDAARADELASDSDANLQSDPELSLILALEAVRAKTTDRTAQVLRRALVASHVRARIDPQTGTALDAAKFSPDGKLIATASEDGSVQISDSHTGEILRVLETGAAFCSDVDWSPDGRRLITADSDGAVITWSASDGQRVSRLTASDAPLQTARYSPDGRSIAIGSQTGYAAVIDPDGRHLRVLRGLTGRVNSVEFSPDSRFVLTASSSESKGSDAGDGARVWSAENGDAVRQIGSGEAASDAEYSSNGKLIAVAIIDGSAEIYTAADGARLGRPLQETDRGAFITRVAFTPDGDEVITGGGGGDVTAWDVLSRLPVDSYRGASGYVLGIDVDASGQRLATTGTDQLARVWDLSTRVATVSSPGIFEPQFDADGDSVMFADGLVRIVDASDGDLVAQYLGKAAVLDAAYSPDRSLIATAEGDGRAELLDAKTGKPAAEGFDQGDPDGAVIVRWSADGERLLTAGVDSGYKVWDVASRDLVGEHRVTEAGGSIFAADLDADGSKVVVAEGGDHATVQRVSDGSVIADLAGHTGLIESVAFDSSGDRVLTASDDGTARIWDANTGDQLFAFNNDGQPVRYAIWSRDDSLIATTGANGELRVWDAGSGREIFDQAGPTGSVGFSDDMHRIAAVGTGSSSLSIYSCEVCGADLSGLEQLAVERITRDPTAQEQALYLGE